MTFVPARAYPAKSSGADRICVNAAVAIRSSDQAVRVTITLNALAQEKLFGGPLIDRRVAVEIGRAMDQGKVRMVVDASRGFAVRRAPKGAARIDIVGWDLLPAEKQRSSAMRFVSSSDHGVVFDLPSWGQPEAARAAMEAKFGIGSAGQVRGGRSSWLC